ncbi:helix-turn-helix domain-containing protein [Desulfofundulus thermosubterraneus]|uniref:Homeodomain-like domain-containing protein n=1 Tax=Desulfofundulus thermosubterraneus DSM 16057 TaxID=1121432 RepID=A0A1M6MK38_9FIRM|nr:helix-turn-helix domain-containing protein [Desulfofundulus thermosubterraneus]SHJ83633.1 Homeodomain-like domain-containing protein [Desulfofundulus thermosubterraneus DSM 16057]
MTITIKGCTVTATEWLSWRERGMSNTEIAAMLGVSPSMARVVARKFREAGVPDPQYRKRKPGPVMILDTATDAGAYVLGVLWGTASTSGEGYWVRHRDRWYVDVVLEHLGVTAEGHESYSRTGNQWRLKITRAVDVATVRNLLERHGWAPRKAPERPYPYGNVDDRGFVRAWVELHSSADVARTGRKREPTSRLRVYGSQPLLKELNRVVAVGVGLPPRRLQRMVTGTGETWCLYYTGGSFCAVVDWLYAGAGLYNPAVRERLEDLTLSVSRLRKPT